VSLNVLVVEYRPDLLQTRAAILHQRGYRVTRCAERHTAVLACGSASFDVAVLGPSIPIDEARRLEWDLRIISPELRVLSISEWDNVGLDEIHKPEFLLQLLDGLVQPQAPTASSRRAC
jgi:DNA-binding NtrC family response regulator